MDNLNDHDPITVIEFCAGYGGLGLGIKGVLGERMRLIGLCELEGFAQANLISKMEAGLMAQVPIWSNLLTFPYRKFRGLVDIAAAGIPCQPHSLAGKRSGGGDERFLFDDWLCGLEQMQPRAIFIENVEGFLSSKMPDGTLCVEWTIKRLEAMGYKSATGIFSAREVGAPHQRKRVFILAHRKCTGLEGLHQWDASSEQIESRGSDTRPSSQRCVWPSRPGQPQHGFEPPRVVIGRMANPNGSQSSEGRGDDGEMPEVPAGEWADDSAIVSGGTSQHRGEDEVVAHTLRSRGEEPSFQPADLPSESGGSNAEAMGDSPTEGLQRPGISGEMDSKSGGAGGERGELAPASAITGDAQRGEGSELANTQLHGHTSAEIAGGIGSEQGEGGMLQPSGVGTSRRDIPDATDGSDMANTRSVCGERPDPDGICGREICESPRRDEVRSEDCGCGESDGGERASVGNAAEQGREGSGRQNDSGGTLLRSSESDGSCANRSMESEQWQAEPSLGECFDESSSILDETLTLNPYGDNVYGYENLSKKRRAREILFDVWTSASSEAIQWTIGGLQYFLAEKILQSGMQLDGFTQRICYFVWCVQTGHKAQGWGLSGMSVYESCGGSSQGQKPLEQFKRELGYAMCQLSYEIALEGGQDSAETTGILHGVRESSERAWVLSQALPEMEEVWRSTLDQKVWEKGCYIEATSIGNRTDELRLLGNGVVPATATLAFQTLLAELLHTQGSL